MKLKWSDFSKCPYYIFVFYIAYFFLLFITFNLANKIPFNSGIDRNIAGIIMYLIHFILFVVIIKRRNEGVIHSESNSYIKISDAIVFMFFLLLIDLSISKIISNVNYLIFPKAYDDFYQAVIERGSLMKPSLGLLFASIGVSLLAAITEELYFRKIIFTYLEDKGISTPALILISGFSFGIMHSVTFSRIIITTISGIILATLYAVTRKVIYPIIAHCYKNALSIFISFLNSNTYTNIKTTDINVEFLKLASRNELKYSVIITFILLVIILTLSYLKRKTILSVDFINYLKKIFNKTQKLGECYDSDKSI